MTRNKFILIGFAAVILFALLVGGISRLRDWSNARAFAAGQQQSEEKIKQLQTENTQHKQNEARLQGRIDELEKQNAEKDAELQASDERVANARAETIGRSRDYEAVRNTVRPVFRSDDDTARADELRADANELYPELFKR